MNTRLLLYHVFQANVLRWFDLDAPPVSDADPAGVATVLDGLDDVSPEGCVAQVLRQREHDEEHQQRGHRGEGHQRGGHRRQLALNILTPNQIQLLVLNEITICLVKYLT